MSNVKYVKCVQCTNQFLIYEYENDENFRKKIKESSNRITGILKN